MQDISQHRDASYGVDLPLERIKNPARGGDRKNQPLIAGDAGVPLGWLALRLIWVQAILVNSKILP